jgi:transposase-like protein
MSEARLARIQISCPHCGHHGNLPVDWRGSQRVKCKKCEGTFYPDTDEFYANSSAAIVIQEVTQYRGIRLLSEEIRNHPMFDEQLDAL